MHRSIYIALKYGNTMHRKAIHIIWYTYIYNCKSREYNTYYMEMQYNTMLRNTKHRNETLLKAI